MKIIILCICVLLVLSGCSNNPAKNNDTAPSTSISTSSSISFQSDKIDLTVLSSTMVYSEVYNMMTEPNKYLGKTVKMKGNFAVYHDDMTGKNYFACIIQDATACCQQGIEFELLNAKYPDDYPKEGKEITVMGIFDTYNEGNMQYFTLRNAKLS